METLPIELVSKIMVDVVYNDHAHPVHCWGAGPTDSDSEVDNYKPFAEYWLLVHRTKPRAFGPLQLGLVCRLWKLVAAQTAVLWNRLAVNLDDVMDSSAGVAKLIDDLRARLVLSRQAPLHILVVLDSWDKLEPGRFREIFDGVLRASHRWASLQMRLPSEHWSILLHNHNHNCSHNSGTVAHTAPRLTRLTHLSLTNLSLIPIVPKNTTLSWHSLTHLVLEGINTRDMSLPLSSVTHLRLVDCNLYFPWPGLARAAHLLHLVLDNCGVDPHTQPPIAPPPPPLLSNPATDTTTLVSSSTVKHFTYHAPFPTPHLSVLAVLAFPALDEFVLTEDTTADAPSAGPIAFLRRCGRGVRRFVLREDPYNTHARPPARVVGLLAHLPAAEHVELEFQYVGRAYFDALFARLACSTGVGGPDADADADTGFLPNLRALQFNSLHGISWPLLPSIFNADADARYRPLRHLTVKNMSALDTDCLTAHVIDELLVLCERGVEICLFNKDNERLKLEELC